MDIIARDEYIRHIEHYLGKQTIIVLTGQRRVGKSFVLKDLALRKQRDRKCGISTTYSHGI